MIIFHEDATRPKLSLKDDYSHHRSSRGILKLLLMSISGKKQDLFLSADDILVRKGLRP